MARNRKEMLAAVMLEKADEQIRNWFGRFNRGLECTVNREDVEELTEFLDLRDELRNECGKPLPALVGIVDEEEGVIDVKAIRTFAGMGM